MEELRNDFVSVAHDVRVKRCLLISDKEDSKLALLNEYCWIENQYAKCS